MNRKSRFIDEVPKELTHFESAFGSSSSDNKDSNIEQANKFISNLSPKINITKKLNYQMI